MTSRSLIHPASVMIAIPCHDGKMMAETAGSLMSVAGLFGAFSAPTECSHPSLVRNIIADNFLRSNFEWLICIDSDIAFARQDYELLLQPTNPDVAYSTEPQPDTEPLPTRMDVQALIPQEDMSIKLADVPADVLVCAEYSYKNEDLKPVRFGAGFMRIHRSVFRTLEQLTHEDGTPRLWQVRRDGRLFYDYYPSGPLIAQNVPTGDWKGEDLGFFTLCHLAGIIPRIETRTRLVHIGRKAYPYLGPDMNAGAQ